MAILGQAQDPSIVIDTSPPRLSDKFLININAIYAKIHDINTVFEENKERKDTTLFHSILDTIKKEKAALNEVRVEINSVLSSLVSYNVLDKVYLEFGRIMSESYASALDQIAFEILGQQAGITEFKSTVVSDPLNVASALLKSKFDVIVNELADVDRRMTTIMNQKNLTSDLHNELVILNELSKTVEDGLNLKVRGMT